MAKTRSLKHAMLSRIGLVACIALGILWIVCVTISVTTNNNVKDDSRSALSDQINRHAQAALKETSNFFISQLKIYEQSIVNFTTIATADTLRSDYSMSLIGQPNFFEYGNATLSPPLTQDNRQIKPVSFSHSRYYVTGATPADIPTFSAALNDTRDRTTHVDPYFRHTYQANEALVAVYTGFDIVPDPNMHREYPGAETLSFDPLRTYDPVLRPWYDDAMASPDNTSFGAPYPDFFKKGWMITGSRTIRHPDTDVIVGVTGADILIRDINNVMAGITFLDSGKLSLFEVSSGQVVSDQEWDLDPDDTSIFTYSDLQNPAVSTDVWNQIASTTVGQSKTITFGDNRAITFRPEEYGAKYVLVVFVTEDEIYKPIQPVIDDMEETNLYIGIGLTIGLLVLSLVIIGFLLHLVTNILQVFHQQQKDIDIMFENIGPTGRKLTDGMEEVPEVNIAELKVMGTNFNACIATLQQQRAGPPPVNAVQQGQVQVLYNMAPGVDMNAAPPAYHLIAPEPTKHGPLGAVPTAPPQPIGHNPQVQTIAGAMWTNDQPTGPYGQMSEI
jgi:hypothetical protein